MKQLEPPRAEPVNVLRRRGALGALSGLGALSLLGCGGGSGSGSTASASGTTTSTGSASLALDAATEETMSSILASAATCTVQPDETEGPYPLRAILGNSVLQRADITEGKTGLPLTLRIKLVDVNNSCAPISGAWVYIWHCDKDGLYSGYDASNNAGQASYNYLRGVQQTSAAGVVTFKTIYPGWYAGRITHIHCMVFLAGSTLSSTTASVCTTQFAFPVAITTAVYNSALYTKGQNTSVTSFAADNVFSDGTSVQMLALSGSVSAGYAGGIVLGVDPTHVASTGSADGGAGTTPPGTTPPGGTPPGGTPPGGGGTPPGLPPGSGVSG